MPAELAKNYKNKFQATMKRLPVLAALIAIATKGSVYALSSA
jgi:hypothetical protein